MIPRNAADNVREDRFPPLDSKLPINRWHKYAEWRRRKTEKTKNLERNRNRNRERERERSLAGKRGSMRLTPVNVTCVESRIVIHHV